MTPVTILGSVLTTATLVILGGGVAAPADGVTSSYGRTHADDGRLRSGCHTYRYHYVVATPTHDWTLETFLVDPNGDTLASGAFLSDSDPERGTSGFRFCRYSTRAGKFTIRAKVHWYNGSAEHKAVFKPSHFRLTR
jgi:hypothetical protein